MSGRKARAARKAQAAVAVPASRTAWRGGWASWKWPAAGAAALAVLVGTFVVPDLLERTPERAAPAGMAEGVDPGAGLPVGSPVPAFREADVQTGEAITSASLAGRKTLLFFSEGVMCQACFEQIKGLEAMGGELERRGIRLVSITPDSPGDLRQAIRQYGITTPMIADDDRTMSQAFNTLGQGMHGDAPGHAFVLVERGTVRWYRDYWLAPTRSMYVEPERVLGEMPSGS